MIFLFNAFLLIGPPRIIARNNYGPMKEGETRKFQIDKNKKEDCKLPGQGVIDIEITKEQSPDYAFTFKMIGMMDKVFIHCDDGYIPKLNTKGIAENCGIGKILTQLCLNEETVHNVESKETNIALLELKKYRKKRTGERKKLAKLKKWIPSHCSKLLFLSMCSKPHSRAHVYFNSAIASGFTEMFMIKDDVKLGGKIRFYPNEGICSVKNLKDRYSDDGDMVELDGLKKTNVWGWNWFFCLPKEEETQQKCTIL